MTRKIAPSEQKAQELAQWCEGQSDTHSGEEVLSAFGRLSTERVLQEALQQAQAEALGRGRYERQPTAQGDRNGDADGPGQTAEGVCRLQRPQVRGLRAPYRSQWWGARGRTREVLTRMIVAMYAGGMSQRDLESALEKALG
jgi:transposase-like protein